VKILSNLSEVVSLSEPEPIVGCLVKSKVDDNATGMIVQILSDDEAMILWSVPPKDHRKKSSDIW
jgi:hypothetical protein